jgi:Peptidase A4 family
MRKVSTITAAVLTALALSAPAWTATAGASAATATPAAQAGPKPVVRVHGMHLVHIQLPRTHLPHLTPHPVVSSGNWAGYAAVAKTGVRLRFIAADFTIPSVSCARSTLGTSGLAYASNWAGIDGFQSNTVEQTGVDSFCDSSGVAQYDAWYEMFPLDPVVFSGVSPGDAISASVFFTGSG